MKDYLMQGGENSVTEKTKKWNRPGMLYFGPCDRSQLCTDRRLACRGQNSTAC